MRWCGVTHLRLIAVAVIGLTIAAAPARGQAGPLPFPSIPGQDDSSPKAKKSQPDEHEIGKESPKGKGENGDKKEKNGDEGKEDKDKNGDKEKKDEKAGDLWPDWLSAHSQGTVVSQGNWKFHSPYEGANSLLPILNYRTTETATIYLDGKLWEGADLVFNPEVSGGREIGRAHV